MSIPFEPLEPGEPRKDLASTYIVPDRFNEKELLRLQVQDELITRTMGGVLTEQPDPAHLARILDIGCGPGGWLIKTAQTHPNIHTLIGIDINHKVVEFANEQASKNQVGQRVEFQSMDALRMLEFPDAFFDLINQRLAISWLRTWDWSKLLQECWRVLHPEGVLRLTELNGIVECNSPAQQQLWDITARALYQAGAYFQPGGKSLDAMLIPLLTQHGFHTSQPHFQTVEYHAQTAEGQLFAENIKHFFRTAKPFLQKWTRLPADYEDLYQQALAEMAHPDFIATYQLFTLCGTRPFA